MLHHRDFYWTRKTTDVFCKKFNIDSKDSIQAFNKANQRGIKSNSDLRDRGKYYIVYPYEVSNKLKMRKNFKNNLTLEEQMKQIDHIKSRIQTDFYCSSIFRLNNRITCYTFFRIWTNVYKIVI